MDPCAICLQAGADQANILKLVCCSRPGNVKCVHFQSMVDYLTARAPAVSIACILCRGLFPFSPEDLARLRAQLPRPDLRHQLQDCGK